jgi:hypothetical protein
LIRGNSANAHEYVLVPFAMESSGLIHPESLKFLEQTADEAELTAKLSGECVLIAFQRALATVIHWRIISIGAFY